MSEQLKRMRFYIPRKSKATELAWNGVKIRISDLRAKPLPRSQERDSLSLPTHATRRIYHELRSEPESYAKVIVV